MTAGIPSSNFPKEDRHEIYETFSDSLGQVTFDGQTLRIEFCAVRMDEVKRTSQPTGPWRSARNRRGQSRRLEICLVGRKKRRTSARVNA